MKNINLTMLTDFYELTMANGYFMSDMKDQRACFDMYFRNVPDNGGYAIMAGLEQLIEYLQDLHFSDEDIDYLRAQGMFGEDFLNYLKNFKFSCDVYSVEEGTPVFPSEPIISVEGPMIEAQFVETMILLLINHQSLIATKANRISMAAQGRPVMEFGTRRAHGASAAIYGARASYIGGCAGTACTLAGREYSLKAMGTMGHSWVLSFKDEYTALKTYADIYPNSCVLLVDTYNVLKSGVPNAIRVFKENPHITSKGIRIDSGDVTYLTKNARAMLDAAGLNDCKIIVSNALDEYIIRDLILQGAKVDAFGVGERLITAKSDPVFGGVYKMAALEEGGKWVPKIKLSENITKITNPGRKELYRMIDKSTGKALADVITNFDESISSFGSYRIFDPEFVWKRKVLKNFKAVKLRKQIFDKGNLVYESPSIDSIKQYCKTEVDKLWEEIKRFENPQEYYVDLSKDLWRTKDKLIRKYSREN